MGAHNPEKKKNGAPSGSDENRETQKRGVGSNYQGAANGQAKHTNEARAHGDPGSGRPRKQTKHSAKAQGTRGWKPEKAKDNGGAHRKRKKKKGHREAATKNARHKRGGGGRGSNHQGAANGQAGDTKEARAHGEPRGGRQKKDTKHSAKAEGNRGRKPGKARDNGGADKRRKKNKRKAPSGSNKNRETQKGGGGAATTELPAAKRATRKRRERTGAEKRKAIRTNNTQRQGPGHSGPETKESKGQRGRAENNNGEKKSKGGGANKGPRRGQPQPGGGQANQKDKAAKGKGEAHRNAPRRPARPIWPRRTSTRTHARDPGVASSDPPGEV